MFPFDIIDNEKEIKDSNILYDINIVQIRVNTQTPVSDLNKTEISEALNIIFESITDAVALDEKVEIRGFGTFSKKYIRPRKFVNPKTKKISYLGETATMHFKPSKSLAKQ